MTHPPTYSEHIQHDESEVLAPVGRPERVEVEEGWHLKVAIHLIIIDEPQMLDRGVLRLVRPGVLHDLGQSQHLLLLLLQALPARPPLRLQLHRRLHHRAPHGAVLTRLAQTRPVLRV